MERILYSFILALLLPGFSHAQQKPGDKFRILHVDAGKVIGQIRWFQGLNGPPSPVMAGLPNLVQQYKELRVDQVRTHDYMGPTDIDAQFTQNNPMLAWLIPGAAQRDEVAKNGNASIIFPSSQTGMPTPKSRPAIISPRPTKC